MDMKPSWKPAGYNSLSPYLVVDDAQALVQFLVAALGAEPLRRFDREDGSVMHAELRIDDSVVMLADAAEGAPAMPATIHLYVPDVDDAYAKAIARGATSLQEPARKDDPDRRGGVLGPCAVSWWFGTQQA